MDRDLQLLMNLLAGVAEELVTLLALDGGSSLFTQLTLDLIGVNPRANIGSSHGINSEAVVGKILNSFQGNLERRLAPETHDGPARGYVQPMKGDSVLLLLLYR